MRTSLSRVRFVAVVLLAACSTLAPASGRAQEPACAAGVSAVPLRGTVRDTAGAPLAGAQVVIMGTSCIAVTDSLGRYDLPRIPAGRVRVRAEMLGYAPSELPMEAYDASTVNFLDFVLVAARFHSGF